MGMNELNSLLEDKKDSLLKPLDSFTTELEAICDQPDSNDTQKSKIAKKGTILLDKKNSKSSPSN